MTVRLLLQFLSLSLVAVGWLLVPDTLLMAADEVTVHLKSGRSFSGFVDPQTSDQELVLRVEAGFATLLRPIGWERIVSATYLGKPLTASELQQSAEAWKSQPRSKELLPSPPEPAVAAKNPTENRWPVTASNPGQLTVRPSSNRVRSIDVRAVLANWNAGVEMDGLVLTIWTADESGQLVAVAGTAEVLLQGLRPAAARSEYVYSRGDPFPHIARWTKRIDVSDYRADGVQLRLPFQALQPEFALDLAAFGQVQVRVSLPGHGTFSATAELVRVRPFSPLRDIRQQLKGERFFPQEQLTRTQ